VAVLVERRPAAGLWGGLWSPPQFESEFAALDWVRREIGEPESTWQALAPIHHAFTHFDLHLTPLRVRCRPNAAVHEGDDRLWYRLDTPARVGLPQPILKVRRMRPPIASWRRWAYGAIVLCATNARPKHLPSMPAFPEAWAHGWHQTMLINENRLTRSSQGARVPVAEMEKFCSAAVGEVGNSCRSRGVRKTLHSLEIAVHMFAGCRHDAAIANGGVCNLNLSSSDCAGAGIRCGGGRGFTRVGRGALRRPALIDALGGAPCSPHSRSSFGCIKHVPQEIRSRN
jgi:hypothetical protein